MSYFRPPDKTTWIEGRVTRKQVPTKKELKMAKHPRNYIAAMTMIDSLGAEVDPHQLATYLTRAIRAYSIANMDDYRNQCDSIRDLFKKPENGEAK